MEAQEAIWWTEHKIRALTQGRGMRPGRAIRRVLNTTDEETQALSSLWVGDEFSVVLGDEESLYVSAYEQVGSCMQGNGALCHRAYTPNGVRIAVAYNGGSIVARGLFRLGYFNTTYGPKAYALGVLMSRVAGLRKSQDWIDDATAARCAVKGNVLKSVEYTVRPQKLLRAVKEETIADKDIAGLIVKRNSDYPGVAFLYAPEKVSTRTMSERVVVFRPHIDRR